MADNGAAWTRAVSIVLGLAGTAYADDKFSAFTLGHYEWAVIGVAVAGVVFLLGAWK